jgi:hypothetical protein
MVQKFIYINGRCNLADKTTSWDEPLLWGRILMNPSRVRPPKRKIYDLNDVGTMIQSWRDSTVTLLWHKIYSSEFH